MRGLNLLRGRFRSDKKNSWARRQSAALVRVSADENLRPVFPGSMLFNHILVPVEQSIPALQTPLLVPDTRDVEFAFCSLRPVENRLQHTALVDFDGAVEHLPLYAIKHLIQSGSPVDRVTVLGKSSRRAFNSLTKGSGASVRLIDMEPEWHSIHSMHSLYRNAEQVIFVDTMRVLDAAYSGCNAVLVATEKFRCDPAFDLLLRHLDKVGCSAYSESVERLVPSQKNYTFAVVENNIGHLKKQLAGEKPTDWLTFFCQPDPATDDPMPASSKPIIPTADMAVGGLWSNVQDRRTRFLRKANKLREDPRSFLQDSNHALLKRVSRVLPERKAG